MARFWLCSATSIAAISVCFLATNLRAQPFAQPATGFDIRGEAQLGEGTQVEIEPSQFPERHQVERPDVSNKASGPQPVITRQTRFGIPFNTAEGALVAEVQLMISTDQGRTWNLYSRQLPSAKEFPFQTAQDGEFWFAVRTIDPNGIANPANDPQAEMIVIVDTTNPELNFNVHTDPSGKLECWWLANDASLDFKTLEINYRPHTPFRLNIARWKKAEMEIAAVSGQPTRFESRGSFWPDTQSLTLDVQAKISDRAGNISVVDRRVLLSRIAEQPQVANQRPSSVDPYAAKQDKIARTIQWQDEERRRVASNQNGWRSIPNQTSLAENTASTNEFAQNDLQAVSPVATPKSPPSTNSYYTGINEDKLQVNPESNVADPTDSFNKPSQDREPLQPMRLASDRVTSQPNDDQPVVGAGQGTQSYPDQEFDDDYYSINDRQSEPRNPGQVETLSDFGKRPTSIAEDNIRLSNSRRFQLDYELDSIGPAGVAKVEIWMTTDEGQSWSVWGQDEDKTSPFIVSVNDDGLYGFRIGVTSKNGLSARPPRPGDDADVWIGVDTTKPTVQIDSVPYGSGEDAGKLIINWQAEDRQLASQPISLFYGTSPDGPWTEIATRIPNDGSYKWNVGETLPRQVYLRIEAGDTANNKAIYILDKPIDLAGLVPRGRIRSVQPLE